MIEASTIPESQPAPATQEVRLHTVSPWDILPADLPAVQLAENGQTILARRYLRRNAAGQPAETPKQLFWRVARFVAEAERAYGAAPKAIERLARRFYALMGSGRFLPNSPTLMNAGSPLGQLSACFVLPITDTLSDGEAGIYDTLRSMALVHQSGGGTGFSFSRLRPEGDPVRSSSGVASGPVSFMRLYDASTDVVRQGGVRRGANMGILRIDHPDIQQFVAAKGDVRAITNFNTSVAVTDAFMTALALGGDYDLLHPTTGRVTGRVQARAIWAQIVHSAWSTGEPGVFFIDRANAHNPVPHLGNYEATNPCGEQPLLPYDVCNLGSINVGAYARPGALDAAERVDWAGLRAAVQDGVRFLDNVIDVGRLPLPAITARAQAIRRIGLGVMGWADLLVRLDIPYDSEEGVALAHEMMGFIDEEARCASEALAGTRGVFPEWERSVWGPDQTAARSPQGERIRPHRRLRNCNLTTVAPTGTISMIAGCSGGIEPLFAIAFQRSQADVRMTDINADLIARAQREGWLTAERLERIVTTGHLHHPEIPEPLQRTYVTAHDIAPAWHVRMQAAFQAHTDAAISKTINFPAATALEEVRDIYTLAYDLGCKGLTIYRDGARPGQVLSAGAPSPPPTPSATTAETRRPIDRKRHRPQILSGKTIKMASPLGDMYVTINEDEDSVPFEVFCTVGKAGGAANADTEAIGRLISLALRHSVPLEEVREQLRGISCDRAVGFGPNKVLSGPDAIAQGIDLYLLRPCDAAPGAGVAPDVLSTCPECHGSHFAFEEGCMKCHICGFNACS